MDRRPRTRDEQRFAELTASVAQVSPGTVVMQVRPVGKGGPGPKRCTVRIGREIKLVLDERDVDRLGIAPGMAWTPGLAEAVLEALAVGRARSLALQALRRRPMTRGMVADVLVRRGVQREVAQRVSVELAERGVINDAAFADAAARAMVDRRPAGKRLIEAKLRGKRVDGPEAKRAAEAALAGHDALADAIAVARRHARSMPPKLDTIARQRRLLGALARRGFEADICRRAVSEVLGKSAAATDE